MQRVYRRLKIMYVRLFDSASLHDAKPDSPVISYAISTSCFCKSYIKIRIETLAELKVLPFSLTNSPCKLRTSGVYTGASTAKGLEGGPGSSLGCPRLCSQENERPSGLLQKLIRLASMHMTSFQRPVTGKHAQKLVHPSSPAIVHDLQIIRIRNAHSCRTEWRKSAVNIPRRTAIRTGVVRTARITETVAC